MYGINNYRITVEEKYTFIYFVRTCSKKKIIPYCYVFFETNEKP